MKTANRGRNDSRWLDIFLFLCIACILYFCPSFTAEAGNEKSWTSKNPTPQLLVEMDSSNPGVKLNAIHALVKAGHGDVRKPDVVDWLMERGAGCLNDEGEWIDRDSGRKAYDSLKNIGDKLVIDSLMRYVFKPELRLHVLMLGVKLGIKGSPERLGKALNEHGDVKMAEDFLNSGSRELYEQGAKWGNNHGYYISQGNGSHRVSWNSF